MNRRVLFRGAASASLLSVCAWGVGCAASEPAEGPLGASDRASYLAQLESIAEADQRHRTALSWGTTDEAELARLENLAKDELLAEMSRRHREGPHLPEDVEARLMTEQQRLDRENTDRLLDLVDRYGWPTEERVGAGVPDMTAVLIHMPMDRVERALPLLKQETLAGRLPAERYAVIYDRKQQHDGKPQLYGTCSKFDPATRSVLAPAIVDIEQTNRARARIGLGPLEQYRLTSPEEAAGD